MDSMLHFVLKKFEGDKYYYCYRVKADGKVIKRAFKYPVRKTKNGLFQYREDWFFGLIKGSKWSEELPTVNAMSRMHDRINNEFIATFCVVVALFLLIMFVNGVI